MFKNLIKKIKTWLTLKWNLIKTWFMNKPYLWIKKNWFICINYIVIILSYNNVYEKENVKN